MDLNSLLSDFVRTNEEGSGQLERDSFFSTLSNNSELQSTLFGALQLDDARFPLGQLPTLLDLLLKWFRHSKDSKAAKSKLHLVLQYIPNLVAVSFMIKADKSLSKRLDGLLLAIYNDQVLDKLGQSTETTFKIQTLANSSLYHDGSRMDNLDAVEQRNGQGLQFTLATFPQISRIHAQNRLKVIEALFRIYNQVLGDLGKFSLEQFVRTVQKMLQRGGGGPGQQHQNRTPSSRVRIVLSSNVLLELLYGAYFAIYNGFQLGGSQIVELIRQRASAQAAPSVLLTVNAIRTVILNSGPSQLPSTSIVTPSQIAKNMITNASFRAKKMGDDIPKVESEALKEEAQATMVVNQLKALANMSSISEEVVEEILEKTPTKSGLDKSLSGLVSSAKDEAAAAGGATEKPSGKYSKEKLIAKLPNLNNLNIRKKLSESERDGGSSGGSGGGGGGGAGSGGSSAGSGARESAGGLGVNQAGGSDGGGGGNPASSSSSSKKSEKKSLIESGSEKVKNATERLSEKRKQKKEQQQQQKEQLLDNNGGIQMQQLQSQQHQQLSQQTSQQQQQPEISIEEVEALIRTKNLPSETITIHSPGSGTTII